MNLKLPPNPRRRVAETYRKHIAPKVDTVQTASKHTLKEILQRASEHLPYVQLYELRRKKTLLSWLPINNTFQKTWRILQTIPQTWSIYSLIFDGKQIIDQAKENIVYIFNEQQLPHHINQEIWLAMLRILLWWAIYYWLTKPWDARAYKEIFSKNNHSSTHPDSSPPPHDTAW